MILKSEEFLRGWSCHYKQQSNCKMPGNEFNAKMRQMGFESTNKLPMGSVIKDVYPLSYWDLTILLDRQGDS